MVALLSWSTLVRSPVQMLGRVCSVNFIRIKKLDFTTIRKGNHLNTSARLIGRSCLCSFVAIPKCVAAGGGGRLNATFGIDDEPAANSTFTRLDATFDLDQQQQQYPPVRGQQQLHLNSTFSPPRKASDDLSRGSSSHDTMDDDR